MEKQQFFEVSELFSFSPEQCYNVMKYVVLPEWKMQCRVGYQGNTMEWGHYTIEIGGDRDDWRGNKIQCLLNYEPPLGFTTELGDDFKIFCRRTGPDTTMVEIIAESGKWHKSSLLNSILEFNAKKIPLFSDLLQRVLPDLYVGKELVVGLEEVQNRSFHEDILKMAMKVIFKDLHETLRRKLIVEGYDK